MQQVLDATEDGAQAASRLSVGEAIDHQINIEMKSSGLMQGTTLLRYSRARERQSGPLSLLAATALSEVIEPGDCVFILTGSGNPVWLPYGETDGPVGAAALARALALRLSARPVMIAEKHHLTPIVASTEAVGLPVLPADLWRERLRAATTETFPLGGETALKCAKQLLDTYQPKAVVSIERTAPNSAGVYHSSLGTGKDPDSLAHIDVLVDEARERGLLTIGIGDGGNEIGYGVIADDLRDAHPFGRDCRCPCDAGIVAATTCDVLVSAAVSNWGAYGVVAMLAYLHEAPDICHSPSAESRALGASIDAGAADGHLSLPILSVDGIPLAGNQAVVGALQSIVEVTLGRIDRPY